jgi:hypothetical protein
MLRSYLTVFEKFVQAKSIVGRDGAFGRMVVGFVGVKSKGRTLAVMAYLKKYYRGQSK